MSAATEARELISDPSRWTRKVGARNAHGHPVDPNDAGAVRFCALGALTRVAPDPKDYRWLEHRLSMASRNLFGVSITRLNDATVSRGGGRKRVLAVYDAVIGAEV